MTVTLQVNLSYLCLVMTLMLADASQKAMLELPGTRA